MRLKVVITVAAIAAALTLCGCSDSQEETPSVESRGSQSPSDERPVPPSILDETPETAARNELIAEYRDLQQRLGQVQQEALADSALQQAYSVLETRIEEEMTAVDPDYLQKRDRMMELQQQMMAAQQSGDQQAMQTIGEEGNELTAQLELLQTKVIELDRVSADIAAFRISVEAKMQEIEPETPRLMARVVEITEALQASASTPGG